MTEYHYASEPVVNKKKEDEDQPQPQYWHLGSRESVPTTVFISNINQNVPEALLCILLKKCGDYISWQRAEPSNGRASAFGFCEFKDPEATMRCIRLLSGFKIGNKRLKVQFDDKTRTQLNEYLEYKEKVVENRKIKWITASQIRNSYRPQDLVSERTADFCDRLDEQTFEADRHISAMLHHLLRDYSVLNTGTDDENEEEKKQKTVTEIAEVVENIENTFNLQNQDAEKKDEVKEETEKVITDNGKNENLKENENHQDENERKSIESKIEKSKKSRSPSPSSSHRDDSKKYRHRDSLKNERRNRRSERKMKRRTSSDGESPDRSDNERDYHRNRYDYSHRYHRQRDHYDDRRNDRYERDDRNRKRSERDLRNRPNNNRRRPHVDSRSPEKQPSPSRDDLTPEEKEKRQLERELQRKEEDFQKQLADWESREKRKKEDYGDKIKYLKSKIDDLTNRNEKLSSFLESYDDDEMDRMYYKGTHLEKVKHDRRHEIERDDLDEKKDNDHLKQFYSRLKREEVLNLDDEFRISSKENSSVYIINPKIKKLKEKEDKRINNLIIRLINKPDVETDDETMTTKVSSTEKTDEILNLTQIQEKRLDWYHITPQFISEKLEEWIKRQVEQFIERKDEKLTAYICKLLSERNEAEDLIDKLQTVFEDEAKPFVLKLFTRIINEIEE